MAKQFSLFSLVGIFLLGGLAVPRDAAAQSAERIQALDGTTVSEPQLDEMLRESLHVPGVAAIAVAVIQDGRIVFAGAGGFLSAGSRVRATPQTIFRAASLSKPVFAWIILKLAEEAVLDLDRPLCQYLREPLAEYPEYADLAADMRYQVVTARMVLCHTTGLPNWRWQQADRKLKFQFEPGNSFRYSGEGYKYLQFVVEKLTGKGLDQLAREKVFLPLGMERSSFLWQPHFENQTALELDKISRAWREKLRKEANAAGSLFTTVIDYARFLQAVMGGKLLRQDTQRDMLKSQVEITQPRLFGPPATVIPEEGRSRSLAWAMGWGMQRDQHGITYFHVGVEPGCENYAAHFTAQETGYVLLSSGQDYSGVVRNAAPKLIGDRISPFDWLGY